MAAKKREGKDAWKARQKKLGERYGQSSREMPTQSQAARGRFSQIVFCSILEV
jgi:hypothetical protein